MARPKKETPTGEVGAKETGRTDNRIIIDDSTVNAAERAVLASILLDNTVMRRLDGLAPEDFASLRHRIIYRTIDSVLDVGDVADIITVPARLHDIGQLEDAGGAAYIAGLTSEPFSPANIEHYAHYVSESHRRRAARVVLSGALEQLNDGASMDDILDVVETLLKTRKAPTDFFTQLGAVAMSPPSWLVRGLLERDSLACVFGPPGSLKSFLAVDIAASVASGSTFRGKAVDAGPVAYVAGEGHSGLRRRFAAWETTNGSLEGAPLFLSSQPVQFGDGESLRPVIAALDRIRDEHGPPKLVVVDTLARCLSGDENSTVDMSAFIAALDRIRVRYGCAILVVHHSGHAEKQRSRGSSAWVAALDTELRVEREGDELRLHATKAKDSEAVEPMQWTLHVVPLDLTDDEGETVTSCVLEPVEYVEPSKRSGPTGKHQKTLLEVLEAELSRHRENVEASGRDPEEARVSFDSWRRACLAAGVPRNRFYQARDALLGKGAIEVDSGYVSCPL